MFATRHHPGSQRERPQTPLVDRIRERGIRLTYQRRIIAELLDQAEDHLDADSIYELAARREPRIHRATVYRTLGTLTRVGLLDQLDLMHVGGERHYYEIRPASFHIHLVCTSCGSVEEPGGPFWEKLKKKVRNETGFRPEVARVEMGGMCSRCRSRVRRNGTE